MSKKYGFKRFRDPSQFGQMNHYEPEVEHRSTYPQIVDSHRLNAKSLLEIKIRRVKIIRKTDEVIKKVKHRLGGAK